MNKEQILKLISEMLESYNDICDETYRQGAIDALTELQQEIFNR
jgi:hypothetical protein